MRRMDQDSLFLRLNETDAKPSADHSAWVLPASEEAGGAANDEEVFVHRAWSLDPVLAALWIACCAIYAVWVSL
jgi:hypothetical protein